MVIKATIPNCIAEVGVVVEDWEVGVVVEV